MLRKLLVDVSLKDYNDWKPLTGVIEATPSKYQIRWPDVNEWFITFGLRAQNDINSYFDLIFTRFPYETFKDPDIKTLLVDMVYLLIEHWAYNRVPIEFFVNASNQINNGMNYNAVSNLMNSAQELSPSRAKMLAKFTNLKHLFRVFDENPNEIILSDIDLGHWYTKVETDELLNKEHQFILDKQMKLYDDVVPTNNNLKENQTLRGPVSKIVNRSYVPTSYDPITETMVLDWPSEIGTLPPEALQPNPQEGDVNHAATADYSAKQQKQINDIKNNYFNLENSPLWKKVANNKDIKNNTWYKVNWKFVAPGSMTTEKISLCLCKKSLVEINLIESCTASIVLLYPKPTTIGLYFFKVDGFKVMPAPDSTELSGEVLAVYEYQGTGTPI